MVYFGYVCYEGCKCVDEGYEVCNYDGDVVVVFVKFMCLVECLVVELVWIFLLEYFGFKVVVDWIVVLVV